jgi:hypothetical protein
MRAILKPRSGTKRGNGHLLNPMAVGLHLYSPGKPCR